LRGAWRAMLRQPSSCPRGVSSARRAWCCQSLPPDPWQCRGRSGAKATQGARYAEMPWLARVRGDAVARPEGDTQDRQPSRHPQGAAGRRAWGSRPTVRTRRSGEIAWRRVAASHAWQTRHALLSAMRCGEYPVSPRSSDGQCRTPLPRWRAGAGVLSGPGAGSTAGLHGGGMGAPAASSGPLPEGETANRFSHGKRASHSRRRRASHSRAAACGRIDRPARRRQTHAHAHP
jgi:hypothetical protein